MPDRERNHAPGQPFADDDAARLEAAAAGPVCPNRRCGRPLDADSLRAGRCAGCKCLVAGNQAALKHGRFAAQAPALPVEAIEPSTTSTYRTQLEADQGGPDDLPAVTRAYCQRLTELEALLRSIAGNLVEHGIFTAKNRTRSALHAYLATVGTWDRVAMRLGLERRKKDVLDLSLQDYLAQSQPHSGQGGTSDGHAPDADQQPDAARQTETQTAKNDEPDRR